MTSTRLPGKVLLPLCGKTVLEVMMERLVLFKDNIIIATTNDGTQQPIIDICQKHGLKFYEGDTQNVLSRYYEAALQFGAKQNDIIVRCTSDCPLMDKEIVQKTIDFFIASEADYTHNSGFPVGISAEVFRFSLLQEAYENAHSEYEKEHVTPYMYISGKDKFKITAFKSEKNESSHRITLDEIDDYTAIQEIYKLFDCRTDFAYNDLVNKLKENPHIFALNSHVVQKS